MPNATHLAKDIVFSLSLISPALAKDYPLYQTMAPEDFQEVLWMTVTNPLILTGLLMPFLILGGIYLALNIDLNYAKNQENDFELEAA